jgi:hypothetical protein
MNPHQKRAATFFLVLLFNFPLCYIHSYGQVVVNGKNLNSDPDLEYIQLMYYVDKSNFTPVFIVDFGLIEPEYTDIIEPEIAGRQQIMINGESITDRVTVVWVMNKMHKAGWEYMGDVVFVPLRSMHNWHVFTLRRKVG